jgi:myo-inositol-1(or 4)-monophosphatase
MMPSMADPTREHAEFLTIAIETARAAGKIIRTGIHDTLDIRYKGNINLVTQIDLASERAIVDRLRALLPDHGILAEEGSAAEGSSGYRWLIDPLDGTTNYAHRFPFFCVSIGLRYEKDAILGVVYDPIRDELFTASRGAGAWCNGHPISVSSTPTIETSLLVTGFSYTARHSADDNFQHFIDFSRAAQGVRRTGSAALDLCYVAAGRFDGFWELNLSPWDTAAGQVLVEEAGGRLTDFTGAAFSPYGSQVVASNGKIHNAMLDILSKAS